VGISSKLLNPGEEVVIDTRTHVKALLVPLFWLVVLLAAGTVAQVYVDHGTTNLVFWILVVLAVLWFAVRPLLVWLTTTYTFTNRRLITRRGIIVRKGHDMPLARINDIAYEFGLIDRVLGCGTLIISVASEDGQIKLHDIPRVEETQRRLNNMLQGEPAVGNDGV
jgi:membrane protein YdbS with pleckstrin-like domain